jgi:hypothetical protein
MPSNPFSSARVRIAFLFLFVLLGVTAYFATDLSKFQERISTQQGQETLRGITDQSQLEDALRQHPSNNILRLMAKATKVADDTRGAIDRLSAQIEPASLSKEINFSSASRNDLDAFRSDLRTAEANVAAFLPRYAAIFKAEHDQVESAALSLHVPKDIARRVLDGLTQRQAKALNAISVTLSARADYYRAYEKYLALLSSEFGSFKVVNGQIIFPLPRTVERYNAVAAAMVSAARRVNDLETDMKKQNQPLPEEWTQLTGAK